MRVLLVFRRTEFRERHVALAESHHERSTRDLYHLELYPVHGEFLGLAIQGAYRFPVLDSAGEAIEQVLAECFPSRLDKPEPKPCLSGVHLQWHPSVHGPDNLFVTFFHRSRIARQSSGHGFLQGTSEFIWRDITVQAPFRPLPKYLSEILHSRSVFPLSLVREPENLAGNLV